MGGRFRGSRVRLFRWKFKERISEFRCLVRAAPVYMLAAWRLDAARPSGELSIDCYFRAGVSLTLVVL